MTSLRRRRSDIRRVANVAVEAYPAPELVNGRAGALVGVALLNLAIRDMAAAPHNPHPSPLPWGGRGRGLFPFEVVSRGWDYDFALPWAATAAWAAATASGSPR
ncbi:MAG: hypothetical protein AMXMBFR61_22200 [Fimbriimonadales bacterium]